MNIGDKVEVFSIFGIIAKGKIVRLIDYDVVIEYLNHKNKLINVSYPMHLVRVLDVKN